MPGEVKSRVEVKNRRQIVIEGVENVNSSDEDKISLETNMGILVLKGADLQITQLNLETGVLTADGYLHGLEYIEASKSARQKSKGFFNRVLR